MSGLVPRVQEGVEVAVGAVGTPVYVHDGNGIRHRARRMRAAFDPDTRAYYSLKAHAGVALLELLREEGLGADACSPGDLAFADAAGIERTEISYCGHSLDDGELRTAVAASGTFVADSIDQLRRAADQTSDTELGLRICPRIEGAFHPDVAAGAAGAKFGVLPEHAVAALDRAGLRAAVSGLHVHLGSDVVSADPFVEAAGVLLDLAGQLGSVRWISLGGGWGPRWADDQPEFPIEGLADAVRRELDVWRAAHERPMHLRVEPGSWLLSEHGYLATTVTEVRPADGDRRLPLLCTDTSYNHLVNTVLYGTRHPVFVLGKGGDAPAVRYSITGNLMQAADVLDPGRSLPEVAAGDVLVFANSGSYKACRAPTFNERGRPAEVLLDGSGVLLTRRREEPADLLSHQIRQRL